MSRHPTSSLSGRCEQVWRKQYGAFVRCTRRAAFHRNGKAVCASCAAQLFGAERDRQAQAATPESR